jgi:hypothetical protein
VAALGVASWTALHIAMTVAGTDQDDVLKSLRRLERGMQFSTSGPVAGARATVRRDSRMPQLHSNHGAGPTRPDLTHSCTTVSVRSTSCAT